GSVEDRAEQCLFLEGKRRDCLRRRGRLLSGHGTPPGWVVVESTGAETTPVIGRFGAPCPMNPERKGRKRREKGPGVLNGHFRQILRLPTRMAWTLDASLGGGKG